MKGGDVLLEYKPVSSPVDPVYGISWNSCNLARVYFKVVIGRRQLQLHYRPSYRPPIGRTPYRPPLAATLSAPLSAPGKWICVFLGCVKQSRLRAGIYSNVGPTFSRISLCTWIRRCRLWCLSTDRLILAVCFQTFGGPLSAWHVLCHSALHCTYYIAIRKYLVEINRACVVT